MKEIQEVNLDLENRNWILMFENKRLLKILPTLTNPEIVIDSPLPGT